MFWMMSYSCFEYSIYTFLASNGNPRSPDSLHYIDPFGGMNSYQRVRLCIVVFLCLCMYVFF